MTQRLVDVLDSSGTVLHTYPITLGEPNDVANDAAHEAKALEAAAHSHLVPDAELGNPSARMHVNRGGQMAPYGDDRPGRAETKADLEQTVCERVYFLQQQDGWPEGRVAEYWHRALDQHPRERAYELWDQEGRPQGRADEYWLRICDFEAR
jgi:hypothetical protein